MKNTHICPKCKSEDIVRVPGADGVNNIQVGWSIFSAVMVHRYVCCECGFSEEWIDRDDILKLKEKYGKS